MSTEDLRTNPSETHETHSTDAGRAPGPDAQSATTTPDCAPVADEATQGRPKSRRGFAGMDRSLVSEIARKGGRAAHSAGTAHEFTSDEARVAGRKGGQAPHQKRGRVGGVSPE